MLIDAKGFLQMTDDEILQSVMDQIRDGGVKTAQVPPCRMGEVAYIIRRYKDGTARVKKGTVSEMRYTDKMELLIALYHTGLGFWGKDIFPTREAAEEELKRSDPRRSKE